MKVVKKFKCSYLLLSFLVLICIFFICFKNSDKETSLKEIKDVETNAIDKELFAMYVKNDEGEYVEYTESNYFPEEYTLNIEKSYCVDKNEKELSDVLVYEDSKITVTSNTTTYCYLYFDISNLLCSVNTPFGECLYSAKTAGFNSSLEGGLYRYQGASGTVDNYVCFGTNDKEECLSDTDAHMYRVIGVDESGRVKLIKNEALPSSMQWYSDSSQNIIWPNSTIYKNINGSSFLTNTTYMSDGWNNKIETMDWKYGSVDSVTVSANSMYSTESEWTNTTSAKIGLIYLYDYAYAYQSGGLNCSSTGSYDSCKSSWIYSGGFSTMSYNGLKGTSYRSWCIGSTGYIATYIISSSYPIIPVFYLTPSVNYISGSGTSSDPFIIS